MWVADTGNHVVRRIDLAADTVESVVGVPEAPGDLTDGVTASEALLGRPVGLALGPGPSLYIADEENHRVVRYNFGAPAVAGESEVNHVAGTGRPSSAGSEAAAARQLSLDSPRGLAVDGDGNLFIAASDVIRLAVADDSGVVTGLGPAFTIFGDYPKDGVVEAAATRISALLLADSGGRLFLVDENLGFLAALRRVEGP